MPHNKSCQCEVLKNIVVLGSLSRVKSVKILSLKQCLHTLQRIFFSDFPELTELLEGIKSVRDKIKKKKKKNQDIFREFHCLCQLGHSTQEPV